MREGRGSVRPDSAPLRRCTGSGEAPAEVDVEGARDGGGESPDRWPRRLSKPESHHDRDPVQPPDQAGPPARYFGPPRRRRVPDRMAWAAVAHPGTRGGAHDADAVRRTRPGCTCWCTVSRSAEVSNGPRDRRPAQLPSRKQESEAGPQAVQSVLWRGWSTHLDSRMNSQVVREPIMSRCQLPRQHSGFTFGHAATWGSIRSPLRASPAPDTERRHSPHPGKWSAARPAAATSGIPESVR